MKPTIRGANAEDIAELARLRWQLYSEDREAVQPLDEYAVEFRGFAEQALTDPTWRAWVADRGDGLAGAMWLHLVPRVPRPGRRAGDDPLGYLTNVYVEPEHRNEGLGSMMLDEVVTWCRDAGVSLVVAWPSERAMSFYERAGFTRPWDPLVLPLTE